VDEIREQPHKEGRAQESRAERERAPSPWEWGITISALLVAAAIGFVAHQAVAGRPLPPKITVEVREIVESESGYVLEFLAHNRGGTTAKSLTIEGQLLGDTGVVATRSATIRYVPEGSTREGGLFFPVDPREYRIRLYPVGYDRP
jgi:uncharacterized protein (TIGR02588 family)